MLPTIRPRSFSRFPLVWLAVYFAIGIACDRFLEPGLWLPGLIAVSIGILAILHRSSAYLLVPLIFLPVGIVCSQLEARSVTENRIRQIYSAGRIDSGEPVEIEGVLLGLPEAAHDGLFLRLRVERLKLKNTRYAV